MSYKKLLERPEWQNRRREILLRDNLKCVICNNEKMIANATIVKGLRTISPENDNLIFQFDLENETLYYRIKNENLIITLNETAINHHLNIYLTKSEEENYISGIQGKFEYDQIELNKYSENNILKDFITDDQWKKLVTQDIIENNTKWYYVPGLQVHHNKYIEKRKPWEYDDNDLITVCRDCHEQIHATTTIKVYSYINPNIEIKNLTPCRKCNGHGYFPEFTHIQNGICFRCFGSQYDEFMDD